MDLNMGVLDLNMDGLVSGYRPAKVIKRRRGGKSGARQLVYLSLCRNTVPCPRPNVKPVDSSMKERVRGRRTVSTVGRPSCAIFVCSSCKVLDDRDALDRDSLDEMLHKMEACGCQPLATILW